MIMNDITRKLASIKKITNIRVHPNADSLEIAEIQGWDVIVKKDIHKVGDLVLYFEVDSFLPVDPRYEFLRKGCFRTTSNLGDGFRIKSMKLRGELSQGLIIPLNEYPDLVIRGEAPRDDYHGETRTVEEFDDVTKWLGVKKYEQPLPSNLTGRVKGNFPLFIPKTDQERIQNITYKERNLYGDDTFELTTKLDGSSMTVYYNEGNFGVCSRNWDLTEEAENLYWQMANKLELRDYLTLGRNFALQGELVGPGVNHNRAQLKEHHFFIFDVYHIDYKRYLTPIERCGFLATYCHELQHVPILDYNARYPEKEEALALADKTMYNGLPAEGIVYKSNQHQFSFKAISNNYLLKNDE